MKNASTVQLGLFHYPSQPSPKQALSKALTKEELWELFRAEYEAARLYPGYKIQIEIPKSTAISQMGRMQVQRFKSSRRTRQDADSISMLGKVAWSRYLGESAEKVFSDWEAALGKGNKGIFWQWPGESVGLRTTKGNNNRFGVTKNRFSNWLTAYAFARVNTQHSGLAYVELLGWAHRYRIGSYLRDQGKFLAVNVDSLKRDGLLMTPSSLRKEYQER